MYPRIDINIQKTKMKNQMSKFRVPINSIILFSIKNKFIVGLFVMVYVNAPFACFAEKNLMDLNIQITTVVVGEHTIYFGRKITDDISCW